MFKSKNPLINWETFIFELNPESEISIKENEFFEKFEFISISNLNDKKIDSEIKKIVETFLESLKIDEKKNNFFDKILLKIKRSFEILFK